MMVHLIPVHWTPEEIRILRERRQPIIRLQSRSKFMMEFLFGVVVGAVLALFVMTAFAHTVGLPW